MLEVQLRLAELQPEEKSDNQCNADAAEHDKHNNPPIQTFLFRWDILRLNETERLGMIHVAHAAVWKQGHGQIRISAVQKVHLAHIVECPVEEIRHRDGVEQIVRCIGCRVLAFEVIIEAGRVAVEIRVWTWVAIVRAYRRIAVAVPCTRNGRVDEQQTYAINSASNILFVCIRICIYIYIYIRM